MEGRIVSSLKSSFKVQTTAPNYLYQYPKQCSVLFPQYKYVPKYSFNHYSNLIQYRNYATGKGNKSKKESVDQETIMRENTIDVSKFQSAPIEKVVKTQTIRTKTTPAPSPKKNEVKTDEDEDEDEEEEDEEDDPGYIRNPNESEADRNKRLLEKKLKKKKERVERAAKVKVS